MVQYNPLKVSTVSRSSNIIIVTFYNTQATLRAIESYSGIPCRCNLNVCLASNLFFGAPYYIELVTNLQSIKLGF